MNEPQFQFEWDETKAATNLHKHGVSFELASSVFNDPRILTVPDLAHSELEERWFSVGLASTGPVLAIAYVWTESEPGVVKIRLITARRATADEMRNYVEGQ